MRSKRMFSQSILGISTGLAGLVLLSGCASTKAVNTTPAPTLGTAALQAQQLPAPPQEPAFTYYPWENDTLQAKGTGVQPEDQKVAFASLSAKNSARINALNNLKQQVRDLPIGSDQSVGSIMDTYLLVRRGVEKHLQSAQTVSDTIAPNGAQEVTINLPLKPLAELLDKYAITPSQELPPIPDNDGFRPII